MKNCLRSINESCLNVININVSGQYRSSNIYELNFKFVNTNNLGKLES